MFFLFIFLVFLWFLLSLENSFIFDEKLRWFFIKKRMEELLDALWKNNWGNRIISSK
jgi:hypothetical protein